MRDNLLPKRRFRHVLIPMALVFLPAFARAQTSFPTPPPPPDPLAGVPVQVLDQQQVTIGTQTVTYNRIAPPVFPAATPTLTPQTTPTTKAVNRTQAAPAKRTASRSPQTRSKKTTRSAQNEAGSGDDKLYSVLSISATVYDHQFTALRWYGGTQPGLQAYVNLDFNSFSTITTLETTSTVYDLIFALSNDTTDSLIQTGQPLPNFSSVPAGHSGYQIVAGDPSTHPGAIAALNAFCAYYDANSAQMIAAYNQQQTYNAAYQQWQQAHPQPTPSTVINFWPVKSSVYPTAP